nr:ParA family protein [uncultured Cohaesibacter sp.]
MDGGDFARSVMTKKAENLTIFNRQSEVFQSVKIAKLLAEASRLDGSLYHDAFARMDGGSWQVLLADLDPSQAIAYRWSQWRKENAMKPDIDARPYESPKQVLADAGNYHIVIVDGAPNASRDTLRVAQAADVVIIPTGTSRDDLIPTVQLANELEKNGISPGTIVFGLNRLGSSPVENKEARDYLERTGYRVALGELRDMVTYRRASDHRNMSRRT